MRVCFSLLVLLSACTTLQPRERTARVPDIPVERKDCESPLGPIVDGDTKSGFLNESEPFGKSCQSGILTCHDGLWFGDFVHPTCVSQPAAP